jgi:N-acetylmuramoyl-L-alanine amidase
LGLSAAHGTARASGHEAPPRAFWLQGQIVAAIPPLPNEGYIQIARRVMADPDGYREIMAFNGNRTPQHGRPVRFPLNTLKPELRGNILRALYPEDEMTERGWAHHVTDPLETLIQLTEAYTGSKRRFRELGRYNRIRNADILRTGTVITVPLEWIPEPLGFRPVAVKRPLTLERDGATGRTFANYALRKNETLYSVILRFTDRERAAEVRRMSGIMVKLNRLRGEDAVPVGRPLRMPIEWISEEYLVQRQTARRVRPPRPPPPKRSAAFEPTHVIIDPGHGGVDPGAVYRSGRKGTPVYEHEVVYDIALRLAGILNGKGFRTHLTVKDRAQPLPVRTISTGRLGKEKVQVTPPYLITSDNVGVNMRVFLIDALYRRLTGRAKVSPDNVILISIHGDALAPTLRGAMVYYPDHRLRVREFRPRGNVYRRRREAIPAAIRFSPASGQAAHWSSKAFGEEIIAALKGQGVRVGGRRPVRSYYYRDGERTLPGVLRYSRVPTSVLVEVANLNNTADRRAILKNATRQRLAKGLAAAVERHRRKRAAVAVSRKAG